jgi:Concanavalin A-like lectin/glucanases superfamily/PEP-CTERM motif
VKFGVIVLAAAAAFASVPANAAVIGDFRLDGDLTNQAGGALMLANNGATLGATGLTFAANQGPTISGFSNPAAYSVELAFSFDAVSGYRKILDFQNRASDAGLYVLNSALNFYPVTTGPAGDFVAGQISTVVLTHDGTSTAGYVNGVQRWSFTGGANSLANITSVLELLRDDFATGQGEASSGFVDYVRVYDTALSGDEVIGLTPPGPVNGPVPEPATWAMMLFGFGLIGTMRRRASVRATFRHA